MSSVFHLPSVGADLVVDKLGESILSSEFTAGNMTYKLSSSSDSIIKISVTFNIQKAKQKTLSEALSMTMEVEINPLTFVKEKVSGLASDVVKKLPEIVVEIAIVVVLGGIAIVATAAAPEVAIPAMAAFLLTYITKTITA